MELNKLYQRFPVLTAEAEIAILAEILSYYADHPSTKAETIAKLYESWKAAFYTDQTEAQLNKAVSSFIGFLKMFLGTKEASFEDGMHTLFTPRADVEALHLQGLVAMFDLFVQSAEADGISLETLVGLHEGDMAELNHTVQFFYQHLSRGLPSNMDPRNLSAYTYGVVGDRFWTVVLASRGNFIWQSNLLELRLFLELFVDTTGGIVYTDAMSREIWFSLFFPFSEIRKLGQNGKFLWETYKKEEKSLTRFREALVQMAWEER